MLLNKKEKLVQFLSGCSTAPPCGMKDYRDLLLNMWKILVATVTGRGSSPKYNIYTYIYTHTYIHIVFFMQFETSATSRSIPSIPWEFPSEISNWIMFLVKFLNPSSSQKLKGISFSTTHSCAKMTSCRSRQEDSLDYLTPVFRHRCSTYFKIIAQSIVFLGSLALQKNPGAETFTRGVYGGW